MTRPTVRRRDVLAWLAAAGAAACGPTTTDPTCEAAATTVDLPLPTLPPDLFTLGVASGDPLSDGVILWTRLAPDPTGDGGMPEVEVPVSWEVATDAAFSDVVQSGMAVASPLHAHSVHVDVTCLPPDTTLWYRFRVGEVESPVGRTRTLPTGEVAQFSFCLASCQRWTEGYYTAHAHLAEEPELGLVLFLGDYIYEGATSDGVRDHEGPEPVDLAGYRARYGLYKSDPALQAAHAAHPWVLTWDDHEVDNNYGGQTDAAFLARRDAAYQAFWEHHPVRIPAPDGGLSIHQALEIGDLVELLVTDTRQYRDPAACGGEIGADPCAELDDPDRTLLGDAQRAWLLDALAREGPAWRVVGSGVVFSDLSFGDVVVNPDAWDGYRAERAEVLAAVGAGPATPLLVSGDIHVGAVLRARTDGVDRAIEVVSGSITSGLFDQGPILEQLGSFITRADAVEFFDAGMRGYVRIDLDRVRAHITFRRVETVLEPTSAITDVAVWEVDRESGGLEDIG